MAVKTFEEIYAQLSADERKVIDNVFAKEPELKGGWTRLDDYSRKTQELAQEKKKFETDLEYAQRMKAWADDAVPKYDALVAKGIIDKDTGEELWTTQKAELEKQLEEARKAAVGGDMDPAELDKRVREIVKAAGGLTPEELKAVVASQSKQLALETFGEEWTKKEKDFNEKTIPFVGGFSAATAVVAMHFEKETGEPWTADKQKELYALMSQKNNFDPFALEADLLAPARAKKAKDKEIQDAIDADRKTRSSMPGGGGEEFIVQGDQKGALQKALEQSGGADFETTIKTHAVEAAKALAAEGKG